MIKVGGKRERESSTVLEGINNNIKKWKNNGDRRQPNLNLRRWRAVSN